MFNSKSRVKHLINLMMLTLDFYYYSSLLLDVNNIKRWKLLKLNAAVRITIVTSTIRAMVLRLNLEQLNL